MVSLAGRAGSGTFGTQINYDTPVPSPCGRPFFVLERHGMALRATTMWNEIRKDTMAGDVTIDIWGGSYADVR